MQHSNLSISPGTLQCCSVDKGLPQVNNPIPCVSASQRAEERAEVAAVWAGAEAGCRDESIPLSEEKIATIKSLMSGVVLGNVPPWARDLGTEGGSGSWRDKLGGQHANPKK